MAPSRLAKFESPIRTVLTLNDAFNNHDVAGMMQLMSDKCIYENSQPALDRIRYVGREEVTIFWQNFFMEFPQSTRVIEEIFSISIRCVMRWKLEWVDAEGVKKKIRGVDLFQVKDDLISEELSYIKG
jgi:hypothetical protein